MKFLFLSSFEFFFFRLVVYVTCHLPIGSRLPSIRWYLFHFGWNWRSSSSRSSFSFDGLILWTRWFSRWSWLLSPWWQILRTTAKCNLCLGVGFLHGIWCSSSIERLVAERFPVTCLLCLARCSKLVWLATFGLLNCCDIKGCLFSQSSETVTTDWLGSYSNTILFLFAEIGIITLQKRTKLTCNSSWLPHSCGSVQSSGLPCA